MDSHALAIDVLSTALQVEPSEVSDSTAIGATERWDSLAHMRLFLAIEEKMGKEVGAEAVVSVENFDHVVQLIESLSTPTA